MVDREVELEVEIIEEKLKILLGFVYLCKGKGLKKELRYISECLGRVVGFVWERLREKGLC